MGNYVTNKGGGPYYIRDSKKMGVPYHIIWGPGVPKNPHNFITLVLLEAGYLSTKSTVFAASRQDFMFQPEKEQ